MPVSKTQNAKIKGVCCAVPNNPISVKEIGKTFLKESEINKISNIVGVRTLYHARPNQTAADLCYAAAEKLICDLGWDKKSIDGIIFVTQTPDYIAPATSCVLQGRLGLSKNCLVLDINYGCSGFIYGLLLASQLIDFGTCKRVLVLVGDTLSKIISKKDKGVSLLFGDGGSATAIEYSEEYSKATFAVYTNGQGSKNLIVPAGGFRKPKSMDTKIISRDGSGSLRTAEDVYMNGEEIFSFVISEIPKTLKFILENHGWIMEEVNKVLLHQANNYMLKYIAKKAKIPIAKIPLNINKFGNTSGATIPLLICDQLKEEKEDHLKVIMSGFGVGLSWGAAALNLDHIHCPEILYV
ncbi:MAG: ketoacyl-ACP synthase III [Marinisporobacter sp.]|jgi:3-oxoacyl-[acyl-carrier-protein] synthase-3|nr:ketoacyl-ACP synthase III [Marinisporobacter sp.]